MHACNSNARLPDASKLVLQPWCSKESRMDEASLVEKLELSQKYKYKSKYLHIYVEYTYIYIYIEIL